MPMQPILRPLGPRDRSPEGVDVRFGPGVRVPGHEIIQRLPENRTTPRPRTDTRLKGTKVRHLPGSLLGNHSNYRWRQP
eukprot:8800573-Pyramimonas_sp.AAC.1